MNKTVEKIKEEYFDKSEFCYEFVIIFQVLEESGTKFKASEIMKAFGDIYFEKYVNFGENDSKE